MATTLRAVKPQGAKNKYDAHREFGIADHAVTAKRVIDKLKLSNEDLLHTYKQALEVRHFEEQCNRFFRAGKVGGYLHLYIGQEAVSLGVLHACKPGDQFLSSYREDRKSVV